MELSLSDLFVHPLIFFVGLALGAIGVWFAMPRARRAPRELGAIVAAAGVGLILLALFLESGVERSPSAFFYVFSAIGLGSALRVITHPRPVYSALFFILTILSSAGLYILLSAEFLAFALVIIYAGAILITYLFVIMLATQAPSADAPQAAEVSDAEARHPTGAVFAGFLLLAALTGLFNSGLHSLPAPGEVTANDSLKQLPGKVERALIEAGFPSSLRAGNDPASGVSITSTAEETFAQVALPWEDGQALFKRYLASMHTEIAASRAGYDVRRELLKVKIEDPGTGVRSPLFASNEELDPLPDEMYGLFRNLAPEGRPAIRIFMPSVKRPPSLAEDAEWEPYWSMVLTIPETADATNLEDVGLALLGQHPLALELAGVILLMALVGAVVIARKQIEHGEADTDAAAARRAA